MKSYDAATGIVILILVAVGLTNFSMYKEEVRPIKLQIIDEVTGEPVRNAIVYYRVQTARIKNILGLPLIDPVYYRNVVEERYYTDEQGCLNLPRRKVYLKLYEHVGREHIYVNLDLVKKTNRIEDFFVEPVPKGAMCNSIKHFKGAKILSSKVELNLEVSDVGIFEFIPNDNSLLKKSDELIIRLRRHEKSD
jgi:hypothetical protein